MEVLAQPLYSPHLWCACPHPPVPAPTRTSMYRLPIICLCLFSACMTSVSVLRCTYASPVGRRSGCLTICMLLMPSGSSTGARKALMSAGVAENGSPRSLMMCRLLVLCLLRWLLLLPVPPPPAPEALPAEGFCCSVHMRRAVSMSATLEAKILQGGGTCVQL